ncbi:hypothetical protein K432DRAFT_345826 [Lepidopterella palustris CBS 459.81]|uniref:Uncharacterized protein n=1 Tax=Lepidopterella palustris CBS 459.81 TaxID=1314670 RepID=A0A8E2EI99_9PEZI|nr:hypothetical protein K432DRAFT_345826 [Lepidopterella palustris CBS 459.81]
MSTGFLRDNRIDDDDDFNARPIHLPPRSTTTVTSRIPTKTTHHIPTTTSTVFLDLPSSPHSTYHIYHDRICHYTLGPTSEPDKEDSFTPAAKAARKARRAARKAECAAAKQKDWSHYPADEEEGAVEFFLHSPHLAFFNPPRVLRAGSTKSAPPVALIHNSFLWRRWSIQLGAVLAEPGVIDPRGVVGWRFNSDKGERKKDTRLLGGYKVRNFRWWGESGKGYVKEIHRRRKENTGENLKTASPAPTPPALADQVIYLTWTSPFSRHTRRYHFRYQEIDFYWKGTGTVRETRFCGSWCRFNHVKLVAAVPLPSPPTANHSQQKTKEDVKLRGKGREGVRTTSICLAKYTSAVTPLKCGKLVLYDDIMLHFHQTHLHSQPHPHFAEQISSRGSGFEDDTLAEFKKTRFYHVVVATAMCMVIGDKQKRETIRKILEIAASEGGGNA